MDLLEVTSIPTKHLFALKDRTILVTGGLGGLASPVINSILESGGDVICLDLPPNPENLERFHTVATQYGTRFSYYSIDVTDETAVSDVFDKAVAALRSPLRGVVTAAGTADEIEAVNYSKERFERIFRINVTGSFLVAQAAARVMQKQKSPGSIVLIASMSGTVTNKGLLTSAYNSSKAAVLQLARSLAAEWGNASNSPPIRVNTVSPGYIITPLTLGALARPGVTETWTSGSMLGRISHPEEYRAPILFLLGDGSSFMTGADLRVDGGHCAW